MSTGHLGSGSPIAIVTSGKDGLINFRGYDTPHAVFLDYAQRMPTETLISEHNVILFNNVQKVSRVTLEAHLEVCRHELERRALLALKGKPVNY